VAQVECSRRASRRPRNHALGEVVDEKIASTVRLATAWPNNFDCNCSRSARAPTNAARSIARDLAAADAAALASRSAQRWNGVLPGW
jgi:hypothetical protein